MSMLVKICGISNSLDAHSAIDAGASAIGFVMGGKCFPVEVEPHAQRVREIIRTFPANVDSFIVTHLLNADDILDLSNYVRSSGIQISEEIDVSIVKEIRSRSHKKIIKTVVVRDESCIQKLKEYEPYCDYLLLDTVSAGYVGGTGRTNDWDLCKQMVAAASKPVYLAGGLTPENVELGMDTVRPQGVDVATGVSVFSDEYPGKDRKCPLRIKSFIQKAHAWHAKNASGVCA